VVVPDRPAAEAQHDWIAAFQIAVELESVSANAACHNSVRPPAWDAATRISIRPVVMATSPRRGHERGWLGAGRQCLAARARDKLEDGYVVARRRLGGQHLG